ncbi:hypothetical protein [Clostridium sp. C2-6-12]|uniref:hypothetical protein n=1 Tax=Clostridium sp. C2-6-12 TaxID=2698832 RepID=UPI00136F9776|nr:hypothetical protein [Clostridium sp. C2-6-12]
MKKIFAVGLIFLLITGCSSNTISQGSNSTAATTDTSKENVVIATDPPTQTDKTLTTDNVEHTNKDNLSLNNVDEYSLIFDGEYISLNTANYSGFINKLGAIKSDKKFKVDWSGNYLWREREFDGITICTLIVDSKESGDKTKSVTAYSPKFKTKRNISVGDKLEKLTEVYKKMQIADKNNKVVTNGITTTGEYMFNAEGNYGSTAPYISFKVDNSLIKEISIVVDDEVG